MSDESPTRGEIWLVRFSRAPATELQRDRPVIVIGAPTYDDWPFRIVVPLTTWQPGYFGRSHKTPIFASPGNGLTRNSAADALQVASLSTGRFLRRLGSLSADLIEEVVASVVLAIGYRG